MAFPNLAVLQIPVESTCGQPMRIAAYSRAEGTVSSLSRGVKS